MPSVGLEYIGLFIFDSFKEFDGGQKRRQAGERHAADKKVQATRSSSRLILGVGAWRRLEPFADKRTTRKANTR
jgi:hypothetical protein